jgi:hypothetical protein
MRDRDCFCSSVNNQEEIKITIQNTKIHKSGTNQTSKQSIITDPILHSISATTITRKERHTKHRTAPKAAAHSPCSGLLS